MSKRNKLAGRQRMRKNAAQSKINQSETVKKAKSAAQHDSETGALLKKFVSDEKYFRRALEIYDEHYKEPFYRKIIDKIYFDLYRFAGTYEPYALYQSYIDITYLRKYTDKSIVTPRFEHANPDRQISEITDDSASEYSRIPTALYLLPFIYAHLKEVLSKSGFITYKQSINDLQNKKIQELLKAVLSGNLGFLVDIVMRDIDSENLIYLDDDLDKLSGSALVHRFYLALWKREKSVCYKILGRAQYLDPGESDYLEATAHFCDHDYNNAIRYALMVREGCPDYGSAVSLLLECYARQGSIVKLVDCISNNKALQYKYLQLVYLRQEAIFKSYCNKIGWFENNSNAIAQLSDYINKSVAHGGNFEDTYYIKLVKNSVGCIIKIYEGYRDAFFYSVNSNPKVSPDIKNCKALASVLDIPVFSSIKILLGKINKYATIISDDWLHVFRQTAMYVIGQITGLSSKIPFINNKTHLLDLFLLGLESMYNLGLFARFTGQINQSIDALLVGYKRLKDPRIADLILRAYIEESIRGNLNEKIKNFVATQLKDRDEDLSLAQKMVARRLSKNGQIALESAEAMFQVSKDIDWGWKDAGMISLGYLRIIEVEVNHQLVLPAARMLGADRINKDYEDVCKSTAAVKGKWKNIVPALKDMLRPDADAAEASGASAVSGLMLGQLRGFFGNIGSRITAGDTLAYDIRDSISKLLSDRNSIDAFISFIENDVVNKDISQKYRNPPAHGEYVTYETACDCRECFYQIMQKLHEALKFNSAEYVQSGVMSTGI